MELTPEEHREMTATVVRILDEWGLSARQQVALLGLPKGTPARAMLRHRRGEPLPQEATVMTQCGDILAIAHSLHLLFPHNPALGAAWATDPGNRHFGCAPVEVMLREGPAGLRRVRALLECGSEWG